MSEARVRSLTHRVLYEEEQDRERRCDVCGELVDNDDDDAFVCSGRGLYVWTRGEETRYEEPPLCAHCGAALGLAQVRRWAIEDDDEG
jgi:hypothetical protein